MATDVPKIGRARDVREVIDRLFDDGEVHELIALRIYRTPEGSFEGKLDFSLLQSRFTAAGLLMWAANHILEHGED